MVEVMPLRSYPLVGSPFRSFYSVLEFSAFDFCRATSLIGQFHQQIRANQWPTDDTMKVVAGELGALQRQCTALDFVSTLAQIERVKEMLFNLNSHPMPQFAAAVMDVTIRLMDEMEARKIYMVS